MLYVYILIGIIILLLLVYYVYKESVGYKVTRYYINSDKISKDKVRFVLISDLHNVEHGEKNCKLYNEIDKYNPDFIVFAGDMVNAQRHSKYDFTNTIDFIANLARKWPVYYGIGNHEEKIRRRKDKFENDFDLLSEKLKEINAPILVNEKVTLDDFNIDILGLDLEHKYYRRLILRKIPDNYIKNALGEVDKNRFSILLAHHPDHFEEYVEYGPDLILSGHLHGGIIILPYLGGVVSPAMRLFPKYYGGEYLENNSRMIVSKGAGTHSIPVRINNKAEIIFIEILR